MEALFARVGYSLNETQRAAIEHLDGPLFLVAGPGSGDEGTTKHIARFIEVLHIDGSEVTS